MSASWPVVSLGDLFEIGAGKSVTPASRGAGNRFPFLRTSNVQWGRIDVTTVDSMPFSDDEIRAKSLRRGDLLVCEGGDIGRSAIWRDELLQCGFQNHLHRLRPLHADVVPEFFMYYLQAGFTTLGIFEGAGNKTTIPNLSRSRLAALAVPRPPRKEQELIATILGIAQRAIEIEKHLIAVTRELKRAAMRKLFAGGIHNEILNRTDLEPVLTNWRVDRLDAFVRFQRGFDITKKEQKPGTIPVVSSGGIRSRHNVAAAKAPGVVIGRKGSIGSLYYLTEDYWPHDTTLWATDFLGNDPLFVFYRLSLLDLKRLDSGTANPALNRNFLHAERVSWPAIEEQQAIAEILACIDGKVSVHEHRMDALEQLFEVLLGALMVGRVDVSDLDLSVLDAAVA